MSGALCVQLKLPGIPRLKVPAHKQLVAKPCAQIPALPEDAVQPRQGKVPRVPTVDEIHGKVATKLKVKNAIAMGSSAGVSNGGRIGAAQVSNSVRCVLSPHVL